MRLLQKSYFQQNFNHMEEQKGTDIGPLVKIISHDLRGPLGNFKNVVALFKAGELQMEQAQMFMEQIEVGVDRSLKLLDDLIEWSHAGSKDKKITQEELNVTEVVEAVCEKLSPRYQEKGITLTFNSKEVEKGFVDKSALKVLTKNLLQNALSFTPKGGDVKVDLDEDARQIIVSVADSGIGIPEKMQDNIFGMGKDNRRLGTEDEKGTGIGLFICKDLVEKNDGRIWLDHSEEHKGTTFKFSVKKRTTN